VLTNDCRCYLINLERSPERLEAMHARLTQLEIEYERVPGIDGQTLDEAEFQQYTRENRYYKPLSRGEVGCYLSHNKALQCFLDSGARFALILEDDGEFAAQMCSIIHNAITLRDNTENTLLQWDLLKLTQRRRRARYIELAQLTPSPSGRGDGASARYLVEYGWSVPTVANATLWTRAGAERWIQAFRGCARPIDCDLQHPWEYGLTILSVHPPVATQTDAISTIGQRKGKHIRSPWPKLRYEANRIRPRLRHFARRYGWSMLLVWLWRRRQTLCN